MVSKFNEINGKITGRERLCAIQSKLVNLDHELCGDDSFGGVPFQIALTACCNEAIRELTYFYEIRY